MEALEISVFNRISALDSGFNNLGNPSIISRVIDLVGIGEISFPNYSFWTWGALVLAIVAAFSGVINKIKLAILRLCKRQGALDSENLHRPPVDDDDESCSSSSSSSASSDDEDELFNSPIFDNRRLSDEDFRVAGSSRYDDDDEDEINVNKSKLRRQFSWSDFARGRSVVKLWDGLGLGLRFDGPSNESVVSMWDLNEDQTVNSFHGGPRYQIPAISRAAPSVVLTAGVAESGNMAFRVWDARSGRQIPAIFAELQPPWKRVVGLDSDEVGEVYFTDENNGVRVRDLRKVGFPIESEEETWWDSDAVIVSDADQEGTKKSSPAKRRSVLSRNLSRNLSRCRDAVKSYLF